MRNKQESFADITGNRLSGVLVVGTMVVTALGGFRGGEHSQETELKEVGLQAVESTLPVTSTTQVETLEELPTNSINLAPETVPTITDNEILMGGVDDEIIDESLIVFLPTTTVPTRQMPHEIIPIPTTTTTTTTIAPPTTIAVVETVPPTEPPIPETIPAELTNLEKLQITPIDAEYFVLLSGLTLGQVSDHFGISIETLLKLNPEITDKNDIMTGTVIKLRGVPVATTSSSSGSSESRLDCVSELMGTYKTVQPGDSRSSFMARRLVELGYNSTQIEFMIDHGILRSYGISQELTAGERECVPNGTEAIRILFGDSLPA